ncbi:MAG: hypothetical protein NC248_11910 [Bacteroides sp.]|nr:hypothetical protein [Bacteroides sp.]MCM1388945.1 hypothetical protein [Bacteroides sp.]
MNKIFEIESIDALREYLLGKGDSDALRERLYAEFLKYSMYGDAREWNVAVRLCEALAIVGWGEHEPLEAIRGRWFNGNPETYFINRDGKPRFLDAVWSKRNAGYAIDRGLSFFHGDSDNPLAEPTRFEGRAGEPQEVVLCSQRNWIPKNPIRIVRGLANCYESSKPVVESIEKELIPSLNRSMRPELYGCAIDAIVINVSFSFYDNYHCKTNYIIADESLKLKQKDFYPKLLEMYSEKEIEDNGYYLRNRYAYKPFRKETGTTRVDIVLEKEFSRQTELEQKRLLSEYLIHAVEQVAKRLDRKVRYEFPLMISDLKGVLHSWHN